MARLINASFVLIPAHEMSLPKAEFKRSALDIGKIRVFVVQE